MPPRRATRAASKEAEATSSKGRATRANRTSREPSTPPPARNTRAASKEPTPGPSRQSARLRGKTPELVKPLQTIRKRGRPSKQPLDTIPDTEESASPARRTEVEDAPSQEADAEGSPKKKLKLEHIAESPKLQAYISQSPKQSQSAQELEATDPTPSPSSQLLSSQPSPSPLLVAEQETELVSSSIDEAQPLLSPRPAQQAAEPESSSIDQAQLLRSESPRSAEQAMELESSSIDPAQQLSPRPAQQAMEPESSPIDTAQQLSPRPAQQAMEPESSPIDNAQQLSPRPAQQAMEPESSPIDTAQQLSPRPAQQAMEPESSPIDTTPLLSPRPAEQATEQESSSIDPAQLLLSESPRPAQQATEQESSSIDPAQLLLSESPRPAQQATEQESSSIDPAQLLLSESPRPAQQATEQESSSIDPALLLPESPRPAEQATESESSSIDPAQFVRSSPSPEASRKRSASLQLSPEPAKRQKTKEPEAESSQQESSRSTPRSAPAKASSRRSTRSTSAADGEIYSRLRTFARANSSRDASHSPSSPSNAAASLQTREFSPEQNDAGSSEESCERLMYATSRSGSIASPEEPASPVRGVTHFMQKPLRNPIPMLDFSAGNFDEAKIAAEFGWTVLPKTGWISRPYLPAPSPAVSTTVSDMTIVNVKSPGASQGREFMMTNPEDADLTVDFLDLIVDARAGKTVDSAEFIARLQAMYGNVSRPCTPEPDDEVEAPEQLPLPTTEHLESSGVAAPQGLFQSIRRSFGGRLTSFADFVARRRGTVTNPPTPSTPMSEPRQRQRKQNRHAPYDRLNRPQTASKVQSSHASIPPTFRGTLSSSQGHNDRTSARHPTGVRGRRNTELMASTPSNSRGTASSNSQVHKNRTAVRHVKIAKTKKRVKILRTYTNNSAYDRGYFCVGEEMWKNEEGDDFLSDVEVDVAEDGSEGNEFDVAKRLGLRPILPEDVPGEQARLQAILDERDEIAAREARKEREELERQEREKKLRHEKYAKQREEQDELRQSRKKQYEIPKNWWGSRRATPPPPSPWKNWNKKAPAARQTNSYGFDPNADDEDDENDENVPNFEDEPGVDYSDRPHTTPASRRYVRKMLHKNPNFNVAAQDLVQFHSWINKFDGKGYGFPEHIREKVWSLPESELDMSEYEEPLQELYNQQWAKFFETN